MERHSPLAAKKLWNFLRVAFFMMKKGLISKRKLIMDMSLMTERGKLLGSSLANLVFHHHRHPRSTLPPGLREYEFSCSNTPVPIFHHAGARRRHNYFPCINATPTMDELEEAQGRAVVAVPMIEYSPQCAYGSSDHRLRGERRSPLPSPFSVRVSNYSLEEEEEGEGEGDGSDGQVDAEAEEFIKRFYEQLRAQRGVALLQYQEMVYQEMIARGT